MEPETPPDESGGIFDSPNFPPGLSFIFAMLRTWCSIALLLLLISGSNAQTNQSGTTPNFEVQKIGPDVYAVIRKEPPSLWFNPNTVFIIGKQDVIVVDSNISSEYTKEVLAALKKITSKPVKYVVNTHWHEDHVIGNHVYRDAFPGVQFIGHRSTLTDLPTIGAANRKGSIENGQGFIDLLKVKLQKGEDLAGNKLTAEERLGYSSDIKLVSSYLAESPNFQIILPTVLVDDHLELDDGRQKIEILYLGKAHTGGDLVVSLPKEKIVVSGDLVVFPIPLVGSTSYPLEYGATLSKLLALNASIIIPGHGPVLRDQSYLKLMIRLLNSIKEQVEAAVVRGETLEQTRKSVNLEEFRHLFAGDSQHKSFIFQNYVFLPATAAAYRQLKEKTGTQKNPSGLGH
ncbi:MAG TPA: MBL fold metallo-hydrolase [Pyrinomonadaceae bacterium]|nr:MBL fold metallo-hydrolase [Pyrinomonadaceae bacterium]